jgi:hypothetical protein
MHSTISSVFHVNLFAARVPGITGRWDRGRERISGELFGGKRKLLMETNLLLAIFNFLFLSLLRCSLAVLNLVSPSIILLARKFSFHFEKSLARCNEESEKERLKLLLFVCVFNFWMWFKGKKFLLFSLSWLHHDEALTKALVIC